MQHPLNVKEKTTLAVIEGRCAHGCAQRSQDAALPGVTARVVFSTLSRRTKSTKRPQQGSAIIIALFIMSLVAAIAVAMLSRLSTDIQRTNLVLNADRANLIAQGSVAWGIDQLVLNGKQQKPNQLIDHLPIHSNVDTKEGYKIDSTLYDAQSFFNINNLSLADNQINFVNLIRAVDPKVEPDAAHNIALAIHDWVTPSENKNKQFDDDYLQQNPSYRAPHRLMASASELRLVKGMSSALFFKLSTFVIALPVATKINITSVTPEILMSLSPSLTLQSAKLIVAHQKESPCNTPEQFLAFDLVKNNSFPPDKITTTSNYFLLQTNVKVGQQNLMLYTLLLRNIKDNQPNVIVLWQTKGTL